VLPFVDVSRKVPRYERGKKGDEGGKKKSHASGKSGGFSLRGDAPTLGGEGSYTSEFTVGLSLEEREKECGRMGHGGQKTKVGC